MFMCLPVIRFGQMAWAGLHRVTRCPDERCHCFSRHIFQATRCIIHWCVGLKAVGAEAYLGDLHLFDFTVLNWTLVTPTNGTYPAPRYRLLIPIERSTVAAAMARVCVSI